jgi:hypothetical protein
MDPYLPVDVLDIIITKADFRVAVYCERPHIILAKSVVDKDATPLPRENGNTRNQSLG